MNKKVNTLLFVLGATIFNVIVAVIFFILFTVLFSMFIIPHIPESAQIWGVSLVFLAAIAASFIIYRFVLKFLMAKIDMEKYFDPIFGKKNIKKT